MPYKDKAKQKEYQRQHFQQNKNLYNESRINRRVRNRAFVRKIKESGKCCYCPESNYLVLDFHHLDDQSKVLDIRELCQKAHSLEAIREEIAKCNLACRNCHRKEHWKDRAVAKTTQQKRRHQLSDLANRYKSKCGCVRCKEKDFKVLDFHHIDPKNKYKDVSRMITQGYGWGRILEEIRLCDVLCSNCHAILHNGS